MQYTFFFISALAFLATAAANCSEDDLGYKTSHVVKLPDVTVGGGSHVLHLTDVCGLNGATLVGTKVVMCTNDYEKPTVRLLSQTQVTVFSLYGGKVSATLYCD